MEAVLPWPGVREGCGTCGCLSDQLPPPAQPGPLFVQVSISERTALNVSGPILVQRQTLYSP